MGILDEAIREHLDLKRQHGAADSELKQLEDEAFGQAERPGDEPSDAVAEAPTEFMAQPGLEEKPESKREPTIADLQEPPPPPPVQEPSPAEEPAPAATDTPAEEAASIVEEEPPAAEQPAMEHEIVPGGPTTEEREAIAEQPTELFDVEEELAGPPSPTDEELVEEEIAEPRLAPADPLAGLEESEEGEVSIHGPAPDDDDEYDDEDDAFWNEQRLSDELDQALEAPVREGESMPPPADEELEAEEPESTEQEYEDEPESVEEDLPQVTAEADVPASHEDEDEDVLGETPDFLEDSEDDQLWFEQKPPKDFDFDD